MLDGLYGPKLEKYWDLRGARLARAGLSPNAVTLAGLALVAAAAGAYLLHRSDLAFGACLALAFAFDGLDGAVARASGRATRFGGYLDAVVDRYQEIFALAAIGYIHDLWPAAFLAMSGALLTSYNKARVALEIPVVNTAWPDLIERLERIVVLVALLLAEGAWSGSGAILAPGLIVLGVLSHATAVQRFFRARGRLRRADGDG
jgi:CDP-diacylglycerol--glycerol-3-phosphate 3-phosphatidyltransferase/archaetidylinositol phosphate synthase